MVVERPHPCGGLFVFKIYMELKYILLIGSLLLFAVSYVLGRVGFSSVGGIFAILFMVLSGYLLYVSWEVFLLLFLIIIVAGFIWGLIRR